MASAVRTFVIFFAPPVSIFSLYFMWVRRTCYSWRAELCDSEQTIYPSLTISDMQYIRQPKEDYNEAMKILPKTDNPGFMVKEGFLSQAEESMLLAEVKSWMDVYGMPYTKERTAAMRNDLSAINVDNAFVELARFFSDFYEDPRPCKVPWGRGDSIRVEKMPPIMRDLVDRVQKKFPLIGEVRHVYVELAPTGQWFKKPSVPNSFSGHDYVVVPLSRPEGTVLTMTPSLRSKTTNVHDVVRGSWSSRDLDVFMPQGSVLRVFSLGRFRWANSIRPGKRWFGHPDNVLPLGPDFRTSPSVVSRGIAPSTSSTLDSTGAGVDLSTPRQQNNNEVPWYRRVFGGGGGSSKSIEHSEVSTSTPAARAAPDVPPQSEALIFLHFEGPATEKQTRRRFWRWEFFSYGVAPNSETYSWDPDISPSAEDVQQKGGFLKWFWQNSAIIGQF